MCCQQLLYRVLPAGYSVLTARFCNVMPSAVLSRAGFHNVLPAATVSCVASRLLCDASRSVMLQSENDAGRCFNGDASKRFYRVLPAGFHHAMAAAVLHCGASRLYHVMPAAVCRQVFII